MKFFSIIFILSLLLLSCVDNPEEYNGNVGHDFAFNSSNGNYEDLGLDHNMICDEIIASADTTKMQMITTGMEYIEEHNFFSSYLSQSDFDNIENDAILLISDTSSLSTLISNDTCLSSNFKDFLISFDNILSTDMYDNDYIDKVDSLMNVVQGFDTELPRFLRTDKLQN